MNNYRIDGNEIKAYFDGKFIGNLQAVSLNYTVSKDEKTEIIPKNNEQARAHLKKDEEL